MKTCEKIKFMRQSKHLKQSEVAEKLGMSLKGYSNIECGKTDLNESRIKKIAQALNVTEEELARFGEKNIYHQTVKMVKSDYNQTNFMNDIECKTQINNTDCKTQIEKLELIIEQKDKEISLLEKQNEDLRAMLDFLRK